MYALSIILNKYYSNIYFQNTQMVKIESMA